MNKALILTTTSGFLSQFELNNVKLLAEKGYQIHYATNFGVPIYEVKDQTLKDMGVVLHHISIEKNPFKLKKNIWALRELVRIIDREQIDVVHCHNPNGGVLGRLAALFSKRRPYVIYTAHGFHFFRGAPLKNWLFFYPVEHFLSRFTDRIITINHEDYYRAKEFPLRKNGKAVLIPGVGLDLDKFHASTEEDKRVASHLRDSLNIPEDAFHIVSAGELNFNKNHMVVIKAIANLPQKNIIYSICGEGPYRPQLEKAIEELGLKNKVFLRGYRNDMSALWHTADASIFPSYREGMGMAALEAMACNVPLIVADNRGSREYLLDGVNGLVCKPSSVEDFETAILRIYEDENYRLELAANALRTVGSFSLAKNEMVMEKVYSELPIASLQEPIEEEARPMVSVIMGVYNQTSLSAFDKAVQSVLNQTFKDFEFLIYNDGSSVDELNQYIDSLEDMDERIKVITSEENKGLGFALNRCIDAARGKYLARMDSDDVSHPNRFAVEVEFMEKHAEYMWCGSNCNLFDENGIWGDSSRPKNPKLDDYLKFSPYIHPTVMYRAALFDKVAGYAEERLTKRCEDYELFMRLFKLGYKGYNIQKPLLNYRVSRKSYHSRSLVDRWRESVVRYEGFRSLGILWPKGWVYVLRPVAAALLPSAIILGLKESVTPL
ncbi:MAG: glycosyltransferase [Lachnospiraceae bacterium]|nr:glycosyltransferase [Lachnospiraceae bacterium]